MPSSHKIFLTENRWNKKSDWSFSKIKLNSKHLKILKQEFFASLQMICWCWMSVSLTVASKCSWGSLESKRLKVWLFPYSKPRKFEPLHHWPGTNGLESESLWHESLVEIYRGNPKILQLCNAWKNFASTSDTGRLSRERRLKAKHENPTNQGFPVKH